MSFFQQQKFTAFSRAISIYDPTQAASPSKAYNIMLEQMLLGGDQSISLNP